MLRAAQLHQQPAHAHSTVNYRALGLPYSMARAAEAIWIMPVPAVWDDAPWRSDNYMDSHCSLHAHPASQQHVSKY